MGYRERKALRGQQQQQAFGKAVQNEQRIPLPIPKTMNTRDNPLDMPSSHAPLIEDMLLTDGGLQVVNRPGQGPIIASTSSAFGVPGGLITYYGSGSTSAEFWAIANSRIWRLTSVHNSTEATASIEAAPSQVVQHGDWIEYQKTIIYVTGSNIGSFQHYWTRANGWKTWSASVSAAGASIGVINGLAAFKNRLYGWEKDNTVFYYSSVDEYLGTFHQFDIGPLITGVIRTVVTLPRDGGDGPDDYIAFISDQGDVVVYSGSNPGDAADWALVGTYKIGNPVSRDMHFKYGNQVVVMCEDDFYFLPQDMSGKHSRSVAATFRKSEPFNQGNAIYSNKWGKILWSTGCVLDPSRDWSFSTVTLCSAPPHILRQRSTDFWDDTSGNAYRPWLAEFKGTVYALAQNAPDGSSSADDMVVRRLFEPLSPNNGLRKKEARLRMAPIKTQGRTQIHLMNPVFMGRPHIKINTSASANPNLGYKIGLEWDQYNSPYATASADILTQVGTSADTLGMWTPGFGTGDAATVYLEVTSASSGMDIFLYRMNLTVSDTGGL